MKRFTFLIIILLTFNTFLMGQELTRAELNTYIDATLPSASAIKMSVLRAVLKEIVFSENNVPDDKLIGAEYSNGGAIWHTIYVGSDRYVRFTSDQINWTEPILILDGTTMDLDTNRIINVSNPIDSLDAVNKQTLDSLLAATKTILELVTVTDPAANEATSTAIIDTSEGVEIVLTAAGNDQTLQTPTITTIGKEFRVLNSTSSTINTNINVNGYVLEPGEFNTFIWDGSAWVGDNIASSFTLNLGATGLYEGGILSGIGLSTFSISDGDGVIIDNTTDHEMPNKDNIAWTGLSTITITNIATAERTYIGIIRSGGVPTVIQQTAPFTASQTRSVVVLGSIAHLDHAIISSLSNTPRVAFDRVLLASDLSSMIGSVVAGNNYSGVNATLNIEKTIGNTYREGANYTNDLTTPNITDDAAINPVTFIYAWRDGSGGLSFGSPTTTIDVNQYDDGTGTLAILAANKYTNQRIFHFGGTNISFVLYGQTIYNSLTEATADAAKEAVEIPADVTEGSSLRSILALKKATVNFTGPLTDGTNYQFLPIGKFGEITSGSTASSTTLQQAYNNSVQPQIITDGGRGAVQFRGGTGTDTDNTIEGLNNAGSTTYSIDGNGDISGNTMALIQPIGTPPLAITSTTLVDNLNVELLNSQLASYYLDYNNFTNTPATGVSSVFGRTGAVIAVSGDYEADEITNTPSGDIAAIEVQAAIDELDTEKAGLANANIFTANQDIVGNGLDLTIQSNGAGSPTLKFVNNDSELATIYFSLQEILDLSSPIQVRMLETTAAHYFTVKSTGIFGELDNVSAGYVVNYDPATDELTYAAKGTGGTVTSVGYTSSDFDITGSPITVSGTFTANLGDNAIPNQTALTSGLVSTDELPVSDAGILKRMDISVLQTYMQNNLSFGGGGVNFGTSQQLPYMNATNDNFLYGGLNFTGSIFKTSSASDTYNDIQSTNAINSSALRILNEGGSPVLAIGYDNNTNIPSIVSVLGDEIEITGAVKFNNYFINPNLASAPGSPIDGMRYQNTTDNKSYERINGSWVDLGQSGGSGLWTLSGSEIYRNSEVWIGTTTSLAATPKLQVLGTSFFEADNNHIILDEGDTGEQYYIAVNSNDLIFRRSDASVIFSYDDSEDIIVNEVPVKANAIIIKHSDAQTTSGNIDIDTRANSGSDLITLNGNATIRLNYLDVGQSGHLLIRQDGSTARTLAFEGYTDNATTGLTELYDGGFKLINPDLSSFLELEFRVYTGYVTVTWKWLEQ